MTSATRPRWPSALLLVAAGGALGGPARYGVDQLVATHADEIPWGTITANLIGAGLLGLLLSLLGRGSPSRVRSAPASASALLVLGTGFLGAFTTLSTYLLQVLTLVGQRSPLLALVYLMGSAAGGVAAAWCGLRLGAELESRSSR